MLCICDIIVSQKSYNICHEWKPKQAKTDVIAMSWMELEYEILEKLVTYTPLYEKGIKKTESKSMETTINITRTLSLSLSLAGEACFLI